MPKKKHRKLSRQAEKFISRKIRINVAEGRPLPQAVAIAYSQARAEGYKVPEYKVHRSHKKLRAMS